MADKQKSSIPAAEIEILRKVISPDLTDEEAALVVAYAQKYNLDVMLKHMVLMRRDIKEKSPDGQWRKTGKVQRGIYITRDGLLHVAHESGKFDGISARVTEDREHAECEVWRKDMGHSFKYSITIAEYDTGLSTWKSHRESMAVKVAEVFTLRRAFDVGITAAEEMEIVYADRVETRGVAPVDNPPEKVDNRPADPYPDTPPEHGSPGEDDPIPPEDETLLDGNPTGLYKVTEVLVRKSPAKDGKRAFVLYTVTTADGKSHKTFSKTVAEKAKEAKAGGYPVKLEFEKNKNGHWDLVGVVKP
jgi:hypothetical protein